MKLIIQSDDLGITEAVSCGIARLPGKAPLLVQAFFLICLLRHLQ